MIEICCKLSKKGSKYLVLVINGVYAFVDTYTIEKIALTNGVSNIDLARLDVDDKIIIKEA